MTYLRRAPHPNQTALTIPTAPILEMFHEWCKQLGYIDPRMNGRPPEERSTEELPPLQILAHRAGYKDGYGQYRKLKSRPVCSLEMADRWLCAMGKVDAWHTHPELAQAYQAAA